MTIDPIRPRRAQLSKKESTPVVTPGQNTAARVQPGPEATEHVQKTAPLHHTSSVNAPAQLQLVDAPIVPLSPTEEVSLDSPLRAAFKRLPPKATRADIRLLNKNRDAWLGLWHIMQTAPDGVDASYFILERDAYGMALLGNLLKQARENKPVRLLVDSAGDWLRMKGFTLPTRGGDYLQELVEYGAEVRIYNPMHRKLFALLFGAGQSFRSVANNHDKLTRSRTMSQTGGRNVARDYLTEKCDMNEKTYRDTCVLLEGEETSEEMKRAFEREFYQDKATFKQFKNLFGNWRKRDGELLGAYLMMDTWVNGDLGLSENELARLDPADVAQRLLDRAIARFPEVDFHRKPGWLTMRSLRKTAKQIAEKSQLYGEYPKFVAKGPEHKDVELKVLDRTSAAVGTHDQLTHAIQTAAVSAQECIRISNPFVTLSEEAIRALEFAGRRGVKIELLTNSPISTDNRITQALFLEDWPRLLARIPNLHIFTMAGDQKLHAKSIEVDGTLTFVKSYNLDLLSERVNSELGIVAWSRSLASAAGMAFEDDLADRSQDIHEYLIERDQAGMAKLDENGEPIVKFGAKDHMPPKMWKKYKRWRWLVRQARKLRMFENHQRPAIRCTVRS